MLVLANAAAGSAADEAAQAALAVLRDHADVEVVVPEQPGDLDQAVAGAAGRPIVVLGGDGSVHGCLQAVVDRGLLEEIGPIGVVPMGTGNDFSRAMGLPFEPAEAAGVALHGELRHIDLLRDEDGGVVVNAVHAGLGAEATVHAEEVKGLLGTAAYALGAVRAGASSSGWHLRVSVDGDVVLDGTRRALMVTVGVGATIGGGAPVAPGASPTNGLAEVVVSTATGPVARVGYALALRRGRHTGRADVAVHRGREVTVEADEPFRVNTDGDVGGSRPARTWTVLPDAWSCRVPAAR